MHVMLLAQARLGSTRYPGKVVAPFCGVPMLVYQVRRFQQADWRLEVLIPKGDLALVALKQQGVFVHHIAGAPADVLGRYARYAGTFAAPQSVLVRLCGDTPLLCPTLLTGLLQQWKATPGLAYLGMGPGWPDGLGDYDVFTREVLLTAHAEATDASDREHVTPWLWRQPARFPQALHQAPGWVREQSWPKLSVDTPADLAYVEAVAQAVQAAYGAAFTWWQVLETIARTPALQRTPEAMNAAYVTQVGGRTWEEVRYGSAS